MIITPKGSAFPIRLTLIALLLLGVSCVPSAPRHPHTLQVLLQGAPEALDPRFALSAYASYVSELIYASLVMIGDDLKPTPLLAERVEARDARTYRVYLRSGPLFHDGRPITAHDVAYTFESTLDPSTRSPHREKFAYLKAVVARDDRTVDFILHKAYAPFVADLAAIGIVPKHTSAPEVGSGPFRLEAWNKNTNQITLAPHQAWFEGAPQIPRLELRVVKDATTRLLELLKGSADLFVGNMVPKQLQVLKERAPWLTQITMPGLGYSYLAMNVSGRHKALANPKVRLAIAHAIDKEAIIRYKFLGLATPASGLLPPGHWAKSSALSPVTYDPEKAKRLLDEAGFIERGANGRFAVTLVTSTDHFRQSLAQIYARSLEAVGIRTTLRIQDWASLFEEIKRGNFEMFSAQWTPVIEPDLLWWVFHSSNIPTQNKGGGNRGGYHNAQVDAWLEEARTLDDATKRAALYAKVEAQLSLDMPYVPLWFEDLIVLQGPRLLDFKPERTNALFGLRKARYEWR